MANTPEGKVKQEVDQLLTWYGVYYDKPVKNGMGAPSLDYHASHKGFYLGIEAKAPGKHLEKRQVRIVRSVIRSGGSVFFIEGSTGLDWSALIGWLKHPGPGAQSPGIIIELARYDQLKRERCEKLILEEKEDVSNDDGYRDPFG